MNSAIRETHYGEKVFVGSSDDPFFVDLGGIFDLGDAPRASGKSIDNLACKNVSTIALQIPIKFLLGNNAPKDGKPESILDPNYVIGVWASASRRSTEVLSSGRSKHIGDWVQVSRLGNATYE
jgi:hypothetical protein